MTEPGLYLIGNAHIDPVWIWDWREGFGEVWATFRSAVDRLRENDELVFTASSAAHYAWIEEHDPMLFAEIRLAVRDGRWAVVGGMWVEPDCNIPSGESFCRQLLQGQRYFERAFGRPACVGYNIDSFGHAAGLQQILRRAGLTSYVMMRPGVHERTLPAQAFLWQDASGAGIPTYRIPFAYEARADEIADLVADGAELAAQEEIPLMLFVGIGNHGGGPTRAVLAEIEQARRSRPQLRYGEPESYFALLEESGSELPVVGGELQHHAVGCYAVSGWVKRANVRAETALLLAEQADAVTARLLDRPARTVALGDAWRELLFCQFHDTLAGTASERAYETVRHMFGYATAIADRVATDALYLLAHRVNTSADEPAERTTTFWTGEEGHGIPFFVYNPLGRAVRCPVIAPRAADRVVDSRGRDVVSQPIASGEVTVFPSHTLWMAELAPFGYEVFWLQGGWRRTVSPTAAGDPVLETDGFRVVVDAETGAIASIVERSSGQELVGAGGVRPVVLADDSDTWSHAVEAYVTPGPEVAFAGWERIEDGPVRRTLRLRYTCAGSALRVDVSVHAGLPFVELRLSATWATAKSVLKLALPWRLGERTTTTAGAAYSFAQRDPIGREEPMQEWLDAYDPDDDAGVACTVDHLYSYDATKATVRLTVLRNPLAADHGGGWAVRRGEDYPYSDEGRHEATVRIHPHRGDWRAAGIVLRALEHRRPPAVLADTYHDGQWPQARSFLAIRPDDAIAITAVKRAADGGATVLRLLETGGAPARATLAGDLLGRDIEVSLAPYELQTLLIPDDESQPARVVDLVETGAREA